MKPYFYTFIGISIGVNVLALLLCLYILIKFLRICKIKDYPFSLPVLEYYYYRKSNNNFYDNLSNKNKLLVIILAYVCVFTFVRLSYKYQSLLIIPSIIFYIALMTCFYCFISDFFIFIIKFGRFIRDFYNYLKTGNVGGRYYYIRNKDYKWIKCFHSDELENVNFFSVGLVLFCLSFGFFALFSVCETFVFEFSDETKDFIFKRFFGIMLILAFSSCLIAIIKESIFLLKKRFLFIQVGM
ncbi:hypothetical protein HDR59_04370 [bacterium]|nr:hypothetical protein [bacterium]